MEDYLSRHSSEIQGASLKSEALWKECFMVNSVISLKEVLEDGEPASRASASERNTVNRVVEANWRQSIGKRDRRSLRGSSKNHCNITKRKKKISKNPAIKLLNEKLLPAKYSADKLIQRVNKLQPHGDKQVTLTLAGKIPVIFDRQMRQMIVCSLHYSHTGRDATLAMIEDIWWPRVHRETIDQARLCEQCLQSGKNLKCIQRQKESGTIPKPKEPNEKSAVDFAGLF